MYVLQTRYAVNAVIYAESIAIAKIISGKHVSALQI